MLWFEITYSTSTLRVGSAKYRHTSYSLWSVLPLYTKAALKNYERVVWMDIDCFIRTNSLFSKTHHSLGTRGGFSHIPRAGRYTKMYVMLFFSFNATIHFDFYIESAQKMIQWVDKNHIAPQMIGPKLLTVPHNIVQPHNNNGWKCQSLADSRVCFWGGLLLSKRKQHSPSSLCCTNLCSSLFEEEKTLRLAIQFSTGPLVYKKNNKLYAHCKRGHTYICVT